MEYTSPLKDDDIDSIKPVRIPTGKANTVLTDGDLELVYLRRGAKQASRANHWRIDAMKTTMALMLGMTLLVGLTNPVVAQESTTTNTMKGSETTTTKTEDKTLTDLRKRQVSSDKRAKAQRSAAATKTKATTNSAKKSVNDATK